MDGREQAWMEPMVLAFSRPAFQLAAALVNDHGVAEEIVQEAFLRALASQRTPKEMPEFRRWLYRIVLNLAREHHRRQARWRKLPLRPEPGLDPEVETERRMGDVEMANALRHLSPREREVAALLATGLSNRQIAQRLVVTERTVGAHVEHILDKLGFASRHQVGAWADEHGLLG